MIKKALFGIALGFVSVVLMTQSAFAQCDCAHCANGGEVVVDSLPVGSDYTQLPAEGCSGGCADGGCSSGSCDDGHCYGVDDRCDCDVFRKCRYFSAFGGWNGIQMFEQDDLNDNSVDANVGSFDEGWIGGFAVGAQVHPRVRYELEAAYRENDADAWSIQQFTDGLVTSSVVEPATGDISSTSGMFNILFDVQPRQIDCWNLYLGGGVGLTQVEGVVTAVTDTYTVNDTSIAFQAILGVNKAINRRVDFFGEYRYFGASNIEVTNTAGSLGDFDYANNSVLFGIRVRR